MGVPRLVLLAASSGLKAFGRSLSRSPDGLHFSSEGYKFLGEHLADPVEAALRAFANKNV